MPFAPLIHTIVETSVTSDFLHDYNRLFYHESLERNLRYGGGLKPLLRHLFRDMLASLRFRLMIHVQTKNHYLIIEKNHSAQ